MRGAMFSRPRAGIRKSLLLVSVVLLAAGGGVALSRLGGPAPPHGQGEGESISAPLDIGGEGFARLEGPWQFAFPRDHGAHPGFQGESWRYYGHLQADGRRRFGFQLTVLRIGLAPGRPQGRASAWAANEFYAGFFAIADAEQERFWSFERSARAALGLSGAEGVPPRLWVENWEVRHSGGANGAPAVALRAAGEAVELELRLSGDRPLTVTAGQDPSGVLASYLATRLAAVGSIAIGDQRLVVSGSAAMEHGWGRLPGPRGQLAWDRFLLHLDDGRDLIAQRLSRRDGSGTPVTTGLLLLPDGTKRPLRRRDLSIEVLERWQAPSGAASYPVRWTLELRGEGAALVVDPYLQAQEVEGPVRHWAGAVRVAGRWQGAEVAGDGYVELFGYVGAAHPG